MRAQRERLGLAPIGTANALAAGDAFEAYENMGGFTGSVLGFFKGLQYNSQGGPNKCFSAVESSLTASSNLFFILARMYMPWYVPEAQLVVQDSIALIGGFYTDCDVNKFFDSMTVLISEEGMSQMGARAGTASQFEWKQYKNLKKEKQITNFQKQAAFGKAFGAVTQYHI